ncbi:hypothetical protein D3C86_1996820 [compost metagenome]
MEDESIAVFGDPKRVAHKSFTKEAASDILEMAKALHASFRAIDGIIECQIENIKASGASYIEAAMQAIVLRHTAGDNCGSDVDVTSSSKAAVNSDLQ